MDILKNLDLLAVGVVIAGIGVLGFTILLSGVWFSFGITKRRTAKFFTRPE